MKQFVKQVSPPIIYSLGKSIYHKYRKRKLKPDQQALFDVFEKRNQGLGEGEMAFRDGMILKHHPDSLVPLEAFCWLYPDMVVEMDRFLELTADRHRLLDIGALHGVFSLAFAARRPENQAIAVNASPIAFPRLLYNVHKNHLTNITPVECAVSAEPGKIQMHYEWEHAVIAEAKDDRKGKHQYISVEKRTGDEICKTFAFEPDVIKIDVEGHELKVLNGLRETLGRNRPLLFLEIHDTFIAQEGDSVEEVIRILLGYGYQASSLEGKPVPMDAIAKVPHDQRIVFSTA